MLKSGKSFVWLIVPACWDLFSNTLFIFCTFKLSNIFFTAEDLIDTVPIGEDVVPEGRIKAGDLSFIIIWSGMKAPNADEEKNQHPKIKIQINRKNSKFNEEAHFQNIFNFNDLFVI